MEGALAFTPGWQLPTPCSGNLLALAEQRRVQIGDESLEAGHLSVDITALSRWFTMLPRLIHAGHADIMNTVSCRAREAKEGTAVIVPTVLQAIISPSRGRTQSLGLADIASSLMEAVRGAIPLPAASLLQLPAAWQPAHASADAPNGIAQPHPLAHAPFAALLAGAAFAVYCFISLASSLVRRSLPHTIHVMLTSAPRSEAFFVVPGSATSVGYVHGHAWPYSGGYAGYTRWIMS